MQHIRHVVLPIIADYTVQAVDVLPSWLLIKDIPQVQCLQSNTASDGPRLRLGCTSAILVAVAVFGRALCGKDIDL